MEHIHKGRMNRSSIVLLLLLLGIGAVGAVLPGPGPVVAGGPINAGDTAWMLTATALVLFMTPGLSFFYGGMVRSKSVISTMMQSFVAMERSSCSPTSAVPRIPRSRPRCRLHSSRCSSSSSRSSRPR